MRTIIDHPLRTLVGLLGLAFVLFMLSASGQPDTFWSNGPSWLGSIGWIGFLLTALAFVLFGLFSIGRYAVRGRRTA